MRQYRQLTEEDRIEIYALNQAGKEQNKIAVKLGVHPSTITRELFHNTGLRGYRPKQARQQTLHRGLLPVKRLTRRLRRLTTLNASSIKSIRPNTLPNAFSLTPDCIARRSDLNVFTGIPGTTKPRAARRTTISGSAEPSNDATVETPGLCVELSLIG